MVVERIRWLVSSRPRGREVRRAHKTIEVQGMSKEEKEGKERREGGRGMERKTM